MSTEELRVLEVAFTRIESHAAALDLDEFDELDKDGLGGDDSTDEGEIDSDDEDDRNGQLVVRSKKPPRLKPGGLFGDDDN